MCAHTRTHVYTHAHIHTHAHIRTHTHRCTCDTHAHTFTHMHVCVHTHMRTRNGAGVGRCCPGESDCCRAQPREGRKTFGHAGSGKNRGLRALPALPPPPPPHGQRTLTDRPASHRHLSGHCPDRNVAGKKSRHGGEGGREGRSPEPGGGVPGPAARRCVRKAPSGAASGSGGARAGCGRAPGGPGRRFYTGASSEKPALTGLPHALRPGLSLRVPAAWAGPSSRVSGLVFQPRAPSLARPVGDARPSPHRHRHRPIGPHSHSPGKNRAALCASSKGSCHSEELVGAFHSAWAEEAMSSLFRTP